MRVADLIWILQGSSLRPGRIKSAMATILRTVARMGCNVSLRRLHAVSIHRQWNSDRRDDGITEWPRGAVGDNDVVIPPIPPIVRTGESLDKKRARLLYQSRKRGILENDLLLSTFFGTHGDKLTAAQLDEYDRLLDQVDWDIYYWMTKARPVPAEFDTDLMRALQEHAENKGKKIMRQPEI